MLAETAAEAARRFGPRAALVAPAGWTLSYAELDRAADEVAVGLAGEGLAEGDVLSLVLPAGVEHVVAYLAAAKLGAVTAAVNPRLSGPERDRVLATAGPALVLATAALAPATLPAGGALHEVVEAGGPDAVLAGLRRSGASPPALAADPDRPIAIVFTSGTTGTPKGAVFGGRQLAFITQTDVGPEWGGGGPAIAGSALAHLGPTTKLAGTLRRGSTQYLTRRFEAAEHLARIARLGIASVGGVPTQLALMLAVPGFEDYDLSAIRAIVIGGGPATPALVREARARFAAPLAVRYSCTEAGIGTGTAFTDPEEDAETTVGRPQPGVTLSVVDGDGRPLPAGERGEVCLSSPAQMAGYWRAADGGASALTPDGAVRTGDLGWVDEAGRLHLAGRLVERYVRGGYNVYPVEVEAVLADHPRVAALAVVPRPDDVMGEAGVAVVVPADPSSPPDLADLRRFAEGRLAHYKLPDEVRTLDALPLTAGEKVDRRALERLVADGGP